jgi:hypothetical protein
VRIKMARWITDEKGVWHPAKEKVSLRNNSNRPIKNPSATWSKYCDEVIQPGDVYIYEGPDRAALYELWEQKIEQMGQDFHTNSDMIQRARELGYKSVDAFVTAMGFDVEKAKKRFDEQAAKIEPHELPKKVEAIEILAGGLDKSGSGQDIVGGFGDEQIRPASKK